jgi:hypothetical protein
VIQTQHSTNPCMRPLTIGTSTGNKKKSLNACHKRNSAAETLTPGIKSMPAQFKRYTMSCKGGSVYLYITSPKEDVLVNFVASRNLHSVFLSPFRSKRAHWKTKINRCEIAAATAGVAQLLRCNGSRLGSKNSSCPDMG